MELGSITNSVHLLQAKDNGNEIAHSANEKPTVQLQEERVLQLARKTNTDENKSMMEKLNQTFKPLSTNLKYEFHEKLKEYYVTIVNPKTEEVVREIPPKKILDFFAAMEEFNGILIDKRV